MNIRRKPSSQGGTGGNYNNNNNQHRKQRYQQGGGEHRPHNNAQSGGNRPRRNYGAMREKYLSQARDALASGDRVLAENYLQHADHCYRMMMEEGAQRQQHQHQNAAAQQQQPEHHGNNANDRQQEEIPQNTSQLPAFLTASYETPEQEKPAQPQGENWDEQGA